MYRLYEIDLLDLDEAEHLRKSITWNKTVHKSTICHAYTSDMWTLCEKNYAAGKPAKQTDVRCMICLQRIDAIKDHIQELKALGS